MYVYMFTGGTDATWVAILGFNLNGVIDWLKHYSWCCTGSNVERNVLFGLKYQLTYFDS